MKGYTKKSYKGTPRISVITVVYNGERYLEQTIKSVFEQNYDNLEYIIIDGGSTDGTLEIIKRYEEQIDYWVSEPDRGIGDAFNKGLRLATGEIIGILNADDWYEPGCLTEIMYYYDKGDILYGKLNYWKNEQIDYTSSPDIARLKEYMSIDHPAVFVKRVVYERIGLFDENYILAMDYEFILRSLINGIKFYYINTVLTNMRSGGLSSRYWIAALREVKKAKIHHGIPSFIASWHLFKHGYLHYIKVVTFQFIQRSPFRFLVKPYRWIKKVFCRYSK